MTEPSSKLTKEHQILIVMRQVLARIVRETTPEHRGLRHPLSEGCIDDIKKAFQLISAREQELAKEAGIEMNERPVYRDQPRKAAVVPMVSVKRRPDAESDNDGE